MSDRFLSVPTVVRAMFRKAGGADSPKLYTGGAQPGASGLREELLASTARPDLVLRFLAEMDRKLDSLLSLLQRETLHVDFPLEGHVVRLSGAGLTLECAPELKPGEYLEILLLLEEYPMRIISALCEVLEAPAQRALTGEPNRAYTAAFTNLEEEDREHIIRFVFSEERKRIRRSRDDS